MLLVRLLSLFRELVGYFPELIRRKMELFAVKIDVIFALDRDQMDVCMRYFESQDHDCYPFARYFLLDFGCYPFCEDHHLGKGPVVEVENVVYLLFRDHQGVPFRQRIDVEKCIVVVIFGDLVRRYFAGDVALEDG